jgi:hypothetical protein
MAEAARLGTSAALERARANQQVAQAKYSAAGEVAGAALMQGLDNIGTGGSFFTPKDAEGADVKGFKNRLGYSGFFGG